MKRREVVVTALLVGQLACSSPPVAGPINLYDAAAFFSSGRRDRTARLGLLRDSVNNRIANVCMRGASVTELEALQLPDGDDRLRQLADGRVLRVRDGRCEIAFPLFLDDRREELAAVARDVAASLEEMAGRVADVLRATDVEDAMIFHLLWSRVIDEMREVTWEESGLEGDLPAVAWVVRPDHPYAVGTNYGSVPGNGSLALTWGPRFTDHLSLFSDARFELARIAWGEPLDDDSLVSVLRQYGLIDASGRGRLLAYPISGELDHLLDSLVTEYAVVAGRAADWEGLADRFDMHPGDLFVVLHHEVSYEIFARLHRAGKLDIPDILLDGRDRSQAVRLVSIATGNPPGPLDEAMAVFMRAGWHGSPEAVELFRQALAIHPNHVDGRFFLGLSLFDLAEYDDAIAALARVETLTRGDTVQLLRYDWARIWIGHIHDVRGERAAAIAAYEEILRREHDSGPMMMGQYGIGPVTAKDWARLRIEQPFARER